MISNVPAAILIAPFTTYKKAVLLGVNVGGLGTLIASLANLIGYKLIKQALLKNKKIPTQVLYGEYPLLIHNRFNRLSLFRNRLIDTSRQAAVPEYTGQLLAFKRLGVHNRSPSY